jgi:hypothetical protein
MPRRTFEIRRSLKTSSAPEVVYGNLINPKAWPHWQSEIVSIEDRGSLAAGDVVRGEADLLGFEVAGFSNAIRGSMETLFEEDVIVGVRMRIRYQVHADGAGTLVTHSLRIYLGEPPEVSCLSS